MQACHQSRAYRKHWPCLPSHSQFMLPLGDDSVFSRQWAHVLRITEAHPWSHQDPASCSQPRTSEPLEKAAIPIALKTLPGTWAAHRHTIRWHQGCTGNWCLWLLPASHTRGSSGPRKPLRQCCPGSKACPCVSDSFLPIPYHICLPTLHSFV